MKKIFLAIILCLIVLIAGCSTKHTSIAPDRNIIAVENNISVHVNGNNVSSQILEMLTQEIEDRLYFNGFTVSTKNAHIIKLVVNVRCFKPGNAALRVVVGLGAGRGSLIYTAEYEHEGVILAMMDGQERFTGCDANINEKYGSLTGFGWEETVARVLVNEAADHIVELALGNYRNKISTQ